MNTSTPSHQPTTAPELMGFYSLQPGEVWRYFKSQHFSFWMICIYLFFEYVRPQSIIAGLDVLPWAQIFLILSLLGWLVDPNRRWVRNSTNLFLLAFFAAVLMSTVWATFPEVSRPRLSAMYGWVIIYFLVINIVNTRRRFLIFLFIFFIASYKLSASLSQVWAMRGFSFTKWGLSGPPGFFTNSGELAIQMAVFWPMALATATCLKQHVKRWQAILMYSMPVTAIMVILGASSRGGQLALVAQLCLLYWRQIFRIKTAAILAVSVTVAWSLLPAEQKVRFTDIGTDTTSRQRMLYWENGLDMLNRHPISGVGYFNFPAYFERHYPEDVLVQQAELPHNIFVQVGAELGYLGLVPYVALIFMAFRIATRIAVNGGTLAGSDSGFAKALAGALNVSFVGFLVAGQFVSVVYYPFMWIHLALAVALKNICDHEVAARNHG